MATITGSYDTTYARERGFFLTMAIVMTLTVVAGFSLQLGMGRSSFRSPPLVHAHAVVFMGWVVINLLQNVFAANGSVALHRRLGWIATGWVPLMIVLGTAVTVVLVRRGSAPFFFSPLQFLVLDPTSVLTFAALTAAAVVLRRRTGWHARLHYCAMALLIGAGIGRLLPMPLLIPWAYEATFLAVVVFPLIGIAADLRRGGGVHPAWWCGIGAIAGSTLLVEAITYSPVGIALYRAVTAGSPGTAVAPLAFKPFPGRS